MLKKGLLAIILILLFLSLTGCGKQKITVKNEEKLNLTIKGKEYLIPIPCTVSDFKKAGFYFYSEYMSDNSVVELVNKPGKTNQTMAGIDSKLENRQNIRVQIISPETGNINEDTVIIERIDIISPDDVSYGKNIKYGMNIDKAVEELGNDYENYLNNTDLNKGTAILRWKKGSVAIRITAEKGIVEEIDFNLMNK